MRIISDITGKEYKTVEECLAAEKAFEERKAQKEAMRKALQKEKEVAYQKAVKACDEFLELCGVKLEFNDDGYKVIYHGNGSLADEIFEDILNTMVK